MSLFYLSFINFFHNVLKHRIAERSALFRNVHQGKFLRQEEDTSYEDIVNYLEQLETYSQTVEIGEAIVGNGQLGRLAQEVALAFSPKKQTIYYRDIDLN